MADIRKFRSRHDETVFDIDGEVFTARRKLPGWAFVEFTRLADSGSNQQQAGEIFDMFAAVLDEDDFERFRKFAKSPQGPTMEVLAEVIQALITDQSERPTERPSSSDAGPPTTGVPSTES